MNVTPLEFTLEAFDSKDGGFVGFVRELPGVITQADTIEELKVNAIDAAKTMLDYLRNNNSSSDMIGIEPSRIEQLAVC